ncbi:hypothetical protein BJ684DRAFT_21637, partial [Piptocephalis cylindrospora]
MPPAESVKAEIARLLEPLCDADPQVLADYVVVLSDTTKSTKEQEDSYQEQLVDFLGDNTGTFIRQLMPLLSSSSSASAGVAPHSNSRSDDEYRGSHSRERHHRDREDRTYGHSRRDAYELSSRDRARPGHEASSGYSRRRSISPPSHEASIQGHSRPTYPMASRPAGPPQSGYPASNRPMDRPRGRCHDFDRKGFCLRGDNCPYDHGAMAFHLPDASLHQGKGGPGMVRTPDQALYQQGPGGSRGNRDGIDRRLGDARGREGGGRNREGGGHRKGPGAGNGSVIRTLIV